MTWQQFVITYGWRAVAEELAHVVGQPVAAIKRLRRGCRRLPAALGFGELFAKWHGRAPADADWPPPRKHAGGYEWQDPELAMVATLVGRIGKEELVRALTARLQRVTGDPTAQRTMPELSQAMHRCGFFSSDIIGGLTTSAAATRAGVSPNLIHQEIVRGKLRAYRVGVRYVVTEAALADWQAGRLPAPPRGWVKLWDLEKLIGMTGTSRLSWYAKNGLVPGALFCAGHRWWIAPEGARELVSRYRRGLPLPWYGKYNHPSTTKRSYERWLERRHRRCAECRRIWARVGGEPRSFEEFHPHWMQIPEQQKRHLTKPDGLSALSASETTGIEKHTITDAIRAGHLRATKTGLQWSIQTADLQAWLRDVSKRGSIRSQTARKGYDVLTFKHAAARYLISVATLHRLVTRGELKTYRRHDGQPGLRPIDVARLHAGRRGLSVADAANYAQVSKELFVDSAKKHGWKPGEPITQRLAHAIRRRHVNPTWLLTFEQAAKRLRRPVAWVRTAIAAGVLKPLRGVDARQIVVGRKAVEALIRRGVPLHLPRPKRGRPVVWLNLTGSAAHAGVAITTIKRWKSLGRLKTEVRLDGTYYTKSSIERAAQVYWITCRFKRAVPPSWFTDKAA